MMIGLGLTAARNLRLLQYPGDENRVTIAQAAPIMLLAILLIAQITSLQGLAGVPDQRVAIYKQVGNWLRENTPEHISVGSLETGLIGFYAQRRMIDFAGLLDPDIAKSMPEGGTFEDAARYAVERYHPEVIVLQEGLFPALEEKYIPENCRTMVRFEDERYPYPVVLYNCQ
jgi:hypothetical protein